MCSTIRSAVTRQGLQFWRDNFVRQEDISFNRKNTRNKTNGFWGVYFQTKPSGLSSPEPFLWFPCSTLVVQKRAANLETKTMWSKPYETYVTAKPKNMPYSMFITWGAVFLRIKKKTGACTWLKTKTEIIKEPLKILYPYPPIILTG